MIPRHAASFMHLIKTEVSLFFLQYPGCGPIFDPPKHIAVVVGHDSHVPGEFY